MLKDLLRTDPSWSLTVIRLALAIMILPHGAQKLLGLFGGYGFRGTMQFFTESMHIPWVFALLAILAEFFGGLALMFGLATRLAAAGIGTVMLVAMLTTHLQHGFFMNWSGNQKGEGIEFFILAIGISLALVVGGGGAWSIDDRLAR